MSASSRIDCRCPKDRPRAKTSDLLGEPVAARSAACFAGAVAEHPDGLQDLVTRTAIARRLHLSRSRVERAADGPGFPAPVGRLGSQIVWRWSDVRAWAEGAEGHPEGPTPEGMRLAGIRDRFRGAGFRLKIAPDPSGTGWQAVRVAPGRRSTTGQAFTGASALEAAESALEWLETHH
jgi:hypothetical protein